MKPVITKELRQFAEEFSENYKIFSCGQYQSNKGKYKLLYSNMSTLVRVDSYSGTMEFSKRKLKSSKYTKNFVFFFVIWCHFIALVGGDHELADELTLKKYLKFDRSKKDIATGYIAMFRGADTVLNRRRIKNIMLALK